MHRRPVDTPLYVDIVWIIPQVTAVYHEKLRHYVDVIIISTEDQYFDGINLGRHLASMTGGGELAFLLFIECFEVFS